MLSLPKPDVIFTHESDLDGFVSGLLLQRLAQHLYGVEVPVRAYPYNLWRQREMREAAAWVSDFSFDLRLDRPNWVLVDHHETREIARVATFIHDVTKSASLLSYELCRKHGVSSPVLDRLVHLSNVADLFLADDPDFVVASDYANLVKTYQFWNLHALIEGRLENLLDHPLLEVMATKRRIEDPLGYDWSRRNLVPLSPKIGLVHTVVGNINLIVHRLLDEPEMPYEVLVTLHRRGNGQVIASLRSRRGQALEVAARLQGGGHANASGAVLPRSIRSIPNAVQYLKEVLNPQPAATAAANTMQSLNAALDLSDLEA